VRKSAKLRSAFSHCNTNSPSVLYPLQSHVDGFGSSASGTAVGESVCGGTVCCYFGGLWLFVAQLFEEFSELSSFLPCIAEEGPDFCLRRLS
jgi:hypothetical protein